MGARRRRSITQITQTRESARMHQACLPRMQHALECVPAGKTKSFGSCPGNKPRGTRRLGVDASNI